MEYADLFDLDDPALEAELLLLEQPISESPHELRRLQRSSDSNGGIATPEELVESWFKVDDKKRHLNASNKNVTYANAVKTRYGVSSTPMAKAIRDPLETRQSPRIAKRVQIVEETAATNQPPMPPAQPTREGRRTTYARRSTSPTPTPPASPKPPSMRRKRASLEGGEMFFL